MKTYSPRRPARHARVPAFLPVPLRARADGWTPRRQAAFLAALARTRSVAAAARCVSMARETAYRLRRRPGAASFAAAWDAALGKAAEGAGKVTPEDLLRRATTSLLKPINYGGRHVATVEVADNSALLQLVNQIGRAEGVGESRAESHRVSPLEKYQLRGAEADIALSPVAMRRQKPSPNSRITGRPRCSPVRRSYE